MAQPTEYNRQYHFQNFQTSSPTAPLPGNQVDAELNAAKQTLDEILANIALIQRDDGELANNSVGRDQLAADLSVGFNAPAAWQTATAYSLLDTVYVSGKFYNCIVAHTSGTFATDLASAYWSEIADFTTISNLSGIRYSFSDSTDTSSEPAEGDWRANNASLASATELALHTNTAEAGSPDITSILNRWAASTTNPKGTLYITKVGANENRVEYEVADVIADTDFYRLTVSNGALVGSIADDDLCSVLFVQGHDIDTSNLMTTDFANAANTIPNNLLDTSILNGLAPVGAIFPWPSNTLPDSNYLFLNGETIGSAASGADNAHADYETLFAMLWDDFGNTELAILDSSGTPTTRGASAAADFAADKRLPLPDLCGRVVAGQDDMGGVASKNRLTNQSGGVDGDVLGDTGGAEQHTLTNAESAAHTHTGTTDGHSHDIPARNVGATGSNDTGRLQHGASSEAASTFTAMASVADTFTTASSGGGGAHNNVQPTIILNWVIKARGTAVSAVAEVGFGGRLYQYSTSTTDAAPGNGFLRLNNVALASATEIWIDNDDALGVDLSGMLQAFTIGHLELRNLTQPGKFARYIIDATATDETGYVEIDVTFESGSGHGDFANGDRVQLVYLEKGAAGATGATANGAILDYAFNTATSGDPGIGKCLVDNATPASVTAFHIHETDRNSNAKGSVLDAVDDAAGGPKAVVTIVNVADTSEWLSFKISREGVDQGDYRTYSVVDPVGTGVSNDAVCTVTIVPSAETGTNRNFLINGGFQVWQRGTSFAGITSAQYTADRWRAAPNGNTTTVSQQTFTVGQTDVPGEPEFFLRYDVTSAAAANAALQQRIPSVRNFAGGNCTVSFYAKAGTSQVLSVRLKQNFGSGGSTQVVGTAQTVTLTTSWQRFVLTFSPASISGKTVGTNSFVELEFYNADNETFTFDFAKIKVEDGVYATPFVMDSFDAALQACEAFFEKSFPYATAPAQNAGTAGPALETVASGTASGTAARFRWGFRRAKIKTPSITTYNPQNTNANFRDPFAVADVAAAVTATSQFGTLIYNTATVVDGNPHLIHATADAEL